MVCMVLESILERTSSAMCGCLHTNLPQHYPTCTAHTLTVVQQGAWVLLKTCLVPWSRARCSTLAGSLPSGRMPASAHPSPGPALLVRSPLKLWQCPLPGSPPTRHASLRRMTRCVEPNTQTHVCSRVLRSRLGVVMVCGCYRCCGMTVTIQAPKPCTRTVVCIATPVHFPIPCPPNQDVGLNFGRVGVGLTRDELSLMPHTVITGLPRLPPAELQEITALFRRLLRHIGETPPSADMPVEGPLQGTPGGTPLQTHGTMGSQPSHGSLRYPSCYPAAPHAEPALSLGLSRGGLSRHPTGGLSRHPTGGLSRHPTGGLSRHPTGEVRGAEGCKSC